MAIPKATKANADKAIKMLKSVRKVISKWGVEALIPDKYEDMLDFAIDVMTAAKPLLPSK